MWKGQGSFECAGFNAGAVGTRDRIYILGGDYSPDEITDDVQVTQRNTKSDIRSAMFTHHHHQAVSPVWSHVCSLGFIHWVLFS